MVTRQDIADALSRIEGVTGLATPPPTPAAGLGWPEWRQTVPSTLTGDEVTWAVHTLLPGGRQDATVLEADPLILALTDSLEDLGVIQTIEPTTYLVQSGGSAALPCITVTITTV